MHGTALRTIAIARLCVAAGVLLCVAAAALGYADSASITALRLEWALPMCVGLSLAAVGLRTIDAIHRSAPVFDSDELVSLVTTGMVLFLVSVLVRQLSLVNPAFNGQVVPIVAAGFVIHHLLPLRSRLSFFAALSLASILIVLGVSDGLWLILLGLALIAVCHLPVRFSYRIAIVCLLGTLFMWIRGIPDGAWPWSAAIWPILGSMFMFRTIIYLYDLRHESKPPKIARSLSYFFMVPNITFPFFPVVDYATFRRTYFDGDPFEIYRRGVMWLLLGIGHLLLYRVVYQYFTISPQEISSGGDLARYMISGFALYLRISGFFHLAVGTLHLFGFNLPAANHYYFFACGFTDLWRRINIYWKDFMLKVFHFPTYFRVRKWGHTKAVILSIIVVFFSTWALHAYQWYWILGTVQLSWTDALFWTILAALLIANVLYDERRRKKVRDRQAGSPAAGWARATGIVGTFATISVLWSLWMSESVGEWLALWVAADIGTLDLATFGGTGIVAVCVVRVGLGVSPILASWRPIPSRPFAWSGTVAAVLLVVIAAGQPGATAFLPDSARRFARDIQLPGLNRQDAAMLQRGYYEDLTSVNQFTGRLWEAYAERNPGAWAEGDLLTTRPTGDFLFTELEPLVGFVYKGRPLRTNAWGMRDRDYERNRADGVYRLAVLGSSYAMGSGVADGETFEQLLEERVLQNTTRGASPSVEILNFSVGGYTPLHQVFLLESKVFEFEPNAIMFVSSHSDRPWAADHLVRAVREQVDIPYPFLSDLAQRAGLAPALPRAESDRRLVPYQNEILEWTYRTIVDECVSRGVTPIWAYIPMPGPLSLGPEELSAQRALAEAAGFHIIDLSTVYDGYQHEALQVAAWDYHPNAEGHRLIAEDLYRELVEGNGVLALGMSTND